MLFSSVLFIFLFLPFALGFHFLTPKRFRNHTLLLLGFVFYFWTEGRYLLVLIASLTINYGGALLLERVGSDKKRIILCIAVGCNLALLIFYKYLGFFSAQLAHMGRLGGHVWTVSTIYLPIGISFFTFKGISYLIDVYRNDVIAERNIVRYGLYQSFFPQLLAGPIARYREMASLLTERSITLAGFWSGAERFIMGLGKKVLIADQLGPLADQVFSMPLSQLSSASAWMGIICYTFQIYFDFSGYSDMAIGLARMFGFNTPENFNYPYMSRSIREFWRRWHITLSRWFMDYLYIPLGGNRKGFYRTYFNLLAVFFICGLWHGASWTFVVWGLWHGLFLVFERTKWGSRLTSLRWINHIYACLAFVLGWVLFRSADLVQAINYFQALCGLNGAVKVQSCWSLINPKVISILIAGAIGSTPFVKNMAGRIAARAWLEPIRMSIHQAAAMLILFAIMILSLSASAFNVQKAFIYFKF